MSSPDGAERRTNGLGNTSQLRGAVRPDEILSLTAAERRTLSFFIFFNSMCAVYRFAREVTAKLSQEQRHGQYVADDPGGPAEERIDSSPLDLGSSPMNSPTSPPAEAAVSPTPPRREPYRGVTEVILCRRGRRRKIPGWRTGHVALDLSGLWRMRSFLIERKKIKAGKTKRRLRPPPFLNRNGHARASAPPSAPQEYTKRPTKRPVPVESLPTRELSAGGITEMIPAFQGSDSGKGRGKRGRRRGRGGRGGRSRGRATSPSTPPPAVNTHIPSSPTSVASPGRAKFRAACADCTAVGVSIDVCRRIHRHTAAPAKSPRKRPGPDIDGNESRSGTASPVKRFLEPDDSDQVSPSISPRQSAFQPFRRRINTVVLE